LTGDETPLATLQRPFAFAADFLHPDLTTGAEYGICANPYFSRVAAVALAPHDARARAALRHMEQPSEKPRDSSATLKDDLRLARYAYQPLLAALLYSGELQRRDHPSKLGDPVVLPFEEHDRQVWYPGAKLASVSRRAYSAWVSAAYGGFVRIAFRNQEAFAPSIGDRGYAIRDGAFVLRNGTYSLKNVASFEGTEFQCEAPFVRAGFVMPPYWARVGLRMSTSLPGGPRASRWLIDQWRRRTGTALNQSSAGVAKGKSEIRLHRQVHFKDDQVLVVDRVVASGKELRASDVFLVMDGLPRFPNGAIPDADRRVPISAFLSADANATCYRISKVLSLCEGCGRVEQISVGAD
jgi:hypothetical protein